MSKSSINKEFYPKAEAMILAGKQQFEVVEELSNEYYDKKRISDEVARMVNPEEMPRVVKEKKILLVLAILLFVFSALGIILKNVYPEVILIADHQLDLLYHLSFEPLIALVVCLEALSKQRKFKIQYKTYMFFSTLMLLNNANEIVDFQGMYQSFVLLKAALWFSILFLNIKWYMASKKRGKQ